MIDRVCLMVFVGVVICLVSVIIIGFRMWYMATGKVVEGQIVGYVKGARSLYAQQGYNYRICLTYKGETYYVTSVDSFTTSAWVIPRKNLDRYVDVYFNPKSPKRVVIKSFHTLEWIAFGLFAFGALIIRLAI